MNGSFDDDGPVADWPWTIAASQCPREGEDVVVKAAAACFAGRNGEIILAHLRSTFLDRRVAPSASDAELRHVEGQRSAIAHLIRLARPRG